MEAYQLALVFPAYPKADGIDDATLAKRRAVVDALRDNMLDVKVEVYESDGNVVKYCLITAPFEVLLEEAEDVSLVRRMKDGKFDEFYVHQRELFEHSDDESKFFMPHERIMLVSNRVERLTAHVDVEGVWEEGALLVASARNAGVVERVLVLHRKEPLDHFLKEYITSRSLTQTLPVEDIRAYFGEKLAIYFGWLDFYTNWLVFPSVLGIGMFAIQCMGNVDSPVSPIFTLLMIIWAALFLRFWHRRCSELTVRWNLHEFEHKQKVRQAFYGDEVISRVTGERIRVYPTWKRQVKTLCSWLVILLAVAGAVGVFEFFLFWMDDSYNRGESFWRQQVPLVLYSAIIPVLSTLFYDVAVRLNKWENHRTETQFEDNLIVKLTCFEFANNYTALFHAAFIAQDMDALSHQLIVILVVRQLINNIQESLLPYLMSLWKQRKHTNAEAEKAALDLKEAPECTVQLQNDDLEDYEGVFDDYLEMVVQFGYIILFAPAFPLAAFLALVNNVMERRTDLFKLVKGKRRPIPSQAADMGTWEHVLYALVVASVLTNTSMSVVTSTTLEAMYPDMTMMQRVGLIVVGEHLLLLVVWVIPHLIPSRPKWVRHHLQRTEHERKVAARRMREEDSAYRARIAAVNRRMSMPYAQQHVRQRKRHSSPAVDGETTGQ